MSHAIFWQARRASQITRDDNNCAFVEDRS